MRRERRRTVVEIRAKLADRNQLIVIIFLKWKSKRKYTILSIALSK